MKRVNSSEAPIHNIAKSAALSFVEMRSANFSHDCYSTHSHDEFSVGVVDQGRGLYINTKSEHDINASTLVTINPGEAHSCNPQSDNWSYRMLFIDTQWIGGLQKEMGLSTAVDYTSFEQHFLVGDSHYQQFSELFQMLQKEANPLLAEGCLIEYCTRLFNCKLEDLLPKKENLSLVQQLIMDELGSQLPLSELCEQVDLSPFHLIRSFKQHYGQTPHAYQLDQRIKEAKLLLKAGKSLAVIALSLGFADQSHFQRHFKKRTAITPRQYQQFFT